MSISENKKEKVIVHNRRVTKITRRPKETFQECIARGVPELIREGMTPEQARAAAQNMCQLKKAVDWSSVLN